MNHGVKEYVQSSDHPLGDYKSRLVIGDVEALRKKSKPIGTNEDVSGIVGDIVRELQLNPGWGLSAIQIGVPKRILVMLVGVKYPGTTGEIKQYVVMINPEYIDKYDEFIYPNEGCLSFPEKRLHTRRYEYVVISDALRNPGRVYMGSTAVAISHEMDHLDGVLFFDDINKPIAKSTLGRNDPCFCGSGKKFKKCCMGKS